jgi:protocatechuate 3,4-dioxygenase beta subunit
MTAPARVLLPFALATLIAPAAAAQPLRNADAPPPPRTGAAMIRGHVAAADSGQPLRKAQVRLMSVEVGPAARDTRTAITDAEGKYEFSGLAGGRYYMTASKGGYISLSYAQEGASDGGRPLQVADAQVVERVDFALPRGGVVTGRITDEYGDPMSNLQVTVAGFAMMNGGRRLMPSGRVATTDDLGEFRLYGISPGQYYVQATWRNPMPAAPPGQDDHLGYAPTLFPGVEDVARAQRLTIGAGDTISDVSFAMVPVKTTTITGTVSDSHGRPMSGTLFVGQQSGGGYASMGGPIRPDGTFTISGITPGEYTLRAQPNGPFSAAAEVAITKIVTTGEDIAGLQLVASPAPTLSGRVVLASAAAAPPAVMLTVAPLDPTPMPMGHGPAHVNDDGTFELTVQPGRSRLMLIPTSVAGGGAQSGGWTIRSVRLNGVEMIDSGIDVKPGQNVDKIEVELTNRATALAGLVTDTNGEPARNATAMAFSQDREHWTGTSRYQGTGRADREGRYTIAGLPPGSYYIVAVERFEPGQLWDPEFLERAMRVATTFVLVEGESRVVDLKLSTVP